MKLDLKIIMYQVLFLLALPLVSKALDSCLSSEEGKERSRSGRLEFCNGTSWIPMGVDTAASCGEPGKTRMSGLDLLFCNGTVEMSTNCSDSGTSCSGSTGKKRYSSGQMQYCNGTNWINMSGGPCPIPSGFYCQGFSTDTSCALAPKGCEWGAFECYPKCSIRNTPALCADLSPDCGWDSGTGSCLPVY